MRHIRVAVAESGCDIWNLNRISHTRVPQSSEQLVDGAQFLARVSLEFLMHGFVGTTQLRILTGCFCSIGSCQNLHALTIWDPPLDLLLSLLSLNSSFVVSVFSMSGEAHLPMLISGVCTVGGLMGYAKARSRHSLIAGVGFGALYAASAYMINKGEPTNGHALALGTSLVLAGTMGRRYGRTGSELSMSPRNLCGNNGMILILTRCLLCCVQRDDARWLAGSHGHHRSDLSRLEAQGMEALVKE
jgi:uncharacterized membrane protein (UPF0136 family)